jgi:ABC-type glycerol-3-phosphate transport system substrate-binding protein
MPLPLETATTFLNLGPLIATDPTFDANDFWPGLMNACQVGGVQVGLPFRANASLIFFDKAAFDATGLPYPEPGWAWEGFRQAAQTLAVSHGQEVTRYGFVDGGNPLGLLAPMVDNLITEAGGSLDGQQFAAALEWYVTLAQENIILSVNSISLDNLINERQTAIWVGSQFGLAAMYSTLADDLGIAPFPITAGMQQSNPITAGCALISAGTNQSQAAWIFLNYLSQQALFTTGLYPAAPARPSIAQSSDYWGTMETEFADVIRTALEHGWYRRAEMPELITVGNALNQALTGEITLAESLPGRVEVQPTAPPPPASTAIAVATPQARSGPAEDALVVTYFPNYGIHSNREATVALARTFNESQDRIYVNVVDSPQLNEGAFGPLEMAAVFDCFAHNGYIEPFARLYGHDEFKATFYSLGPLMDGEEVAFQNEYDTNWLELNQVDGELFALPAAVRPYIIQYNANILANMGLDPPTPDWTVEEFWILAQAATRSEGSPPIYGFVPNILWPGNLLLFIPGAEYPFDPHSEPPYRPLFDTSATSQALIWLVQMAERGVMFPSDYFGAHQTWEYDREQRDQQRNLIYSGQAAMWVEQAGDVPHHLDVGTAPFPQTDLQATFGQFPDPSMLIISKRTPDPTGCWEWFKFFTAHLDAFSGVPLRRSVRSSADWLDRVGREAAAAYEIMISRPRLDVTLIGANYPYRFWWSDIMHAVFAGESPAAVLERFQLLAEAFHACYLQAELPNLDQARACVQQVDPDFWQGRTVLTP